MASYGLFIMYMLAYLMLRHTNPVVIPHRSRSQRHHSNANIAARNQNQTPTRRNRLRLFGPNHDLLVVTDASTLSCTAALLRLVIPLVLAP